MPTVTGRVNWSIAHQVSRMMSMNWEENSPLAFSTYFMIGQRPIEYARNKIVQAFMNQSDSHCLMMVDEDQVMPDNFWELLKVPADIVSGTTNVWVGNEYLPGRLRVNQYSLNENAQCFNISPPENKSAPYYVPIVGTGCIIVRRRVFEKLGLSPFRFTYAPDGKVMAGEDVNFCMDAQKAGFRVAVHPGVRFGHVKEVDLAQIAEYEEASFKFRSSGGQHTPNDMLSVAV